MEDLPTRCLVARSLNTVRHNHTKLEINNLQRTPIFIERGQKLVEFEPLRKVYRATIVGGNYHKNDEQDPVLKCELFYLPETN